MNKATRAKKPESTVIERHLEKHGLSQEEFAKKFKPAVSQGLIWQWIEWLKNPKKGTRITAERAKEIEEITGGEIKRWELRPDVFEAAA